MIPPPLPHLHILNKNLKGGTYKTGKVLIVIHLGVNYLICGRCQKFEVKPGELVLIIRGILTLLHLSHCWLLCWALCKPWMGIVALEHFNSKIILFYFFPKSSGFQSASFNCDKSGMQHSHCSPEPLQCKVGIHSLELHHVGNYECDDVVRIISNFHGTDKNRK